MARPQTAEGKLSPEHRVVVPREVRAALGVGAGDRIVFHLDADGGVHLLTPRLMAMALWANNHGGDAGNSAEDIRQERIADQDAADRKHERISTFLAADERSEDDVAAQLWSALESR